MEDQLNRCKAVLSESVSSFTTVRDTAFYFFDELVKHYDQAGLLVSQQRLDLLTCLFKRRMRITWFVSDEELDATWTGTELQDNAWKYCQEHSSLPSWSAKPYVPRFSSRCLVFVHFFSGVRREGDLQQFLERIPIPESCTRVVLSLDIVFDSKRATT